MYTILATNPDEALYRGMELLHEIGVREDSRNGAVLVAPTPVTTVYSPLQTRVSRSALRDANPFFHLFESLWMLAGRNDVASVAKYVPRMAEFSDDGVTLNGAYGYRWREHFDYDQLEGIIDELAANPNTRRAVLAMWDASVHEGRESDLYAAAHGSKDVPCNTHAYFRIRHEEMPFGPGERLVLDMTVCCRSNDIVWGAYGANVVHFSMLQEYMALAVGVSVGRYFQMSNNYHAYIERPDVARLTPAALGMEPKAEHAVNYSLFATPGERAAFDADCRDFFNGLNDDGFRTAYFNRVVEPMRAAHQLYKGGDVERAIKSLSESPYDWHLAARDWLARRAAKQAAKTEVR